MCDCLSERERERDYYADRRATWKGKADGKPGAASTLLYCYTVAYCTDSNSSVGLQVATTHEWEHRSLLNHY